MKKLIAALLALVIVFAGVIGFQQWKEMKSFAPDEETESIVPAEEETAEEEGMKAQLPDFAALYAEHSPDEIVMTVDGEPVTWEQYFYSLQYNTSVVYYYLSMYYSYGSNFAWTDIMSEDGMTFADYVQMGTEQTLAQQLAIEKHARELGYELSEDDLTAMAEEMQELKIQACGENATDADFEAYLAGQYLTPELYERLVKSNYLYRGLMPFEYGEDGANVSDEDAMSYLTENGYEFRCTHILFLTVDMMTGEALSEEEIAAKLAKAQEITEELRAIEDDEERLAHFNELKAELCEDSGKETYPDGYIFTAGQMVPEFEETTAALGDYEVSDPVKSSYGYHVIMGLPMDVDATVQYSDAGTALNARALYANAAFAKWMENAIKTAEIVYTDSFLGYTMVK